MLDGKRCLIESKTTTGRYLEEPTGLLALDPRLICYSWISGTSDAAVVAFVRKGVPEIQYLKTTITTLIDHSEICHRRFLTDSFGNVKSALVSPSSSSAGPAKPRVHRNRHSHAQRRRRNLKTYADAIDRRARRRERKRIRPAKEPYVR